MERAVSPDSDDAREAHANNVYSLGVTRQLLAIPPIPTQNGLYVSILTPNQ